MKVHVEESVPFGVQFLEPASVGETKPSTEWDWIPNEGARIDLIDVKGSIPGTTGTGPDAKQDERQEEC